MAEDEMLVATARFAWEEGMRRLAEPGPLAAERRAIADAVGQELRRRVGISFTLAELARAWDDAQTWYLDVASRVAPRSPEAWDPAAALDGAFAVHARLASDTRG